MTENTGFTPCNRRKFVKTAASLAMLTPLWGHSLDYGYSLGLRNSTKSWIPSAALLKSLPQQLEKQGLTALSMAVIDQSGTTWRHSENLEPAAQQEEPTFEAGSLAKPIAAIATLQLKEQGVLNWDRPLMEYFPLKDLQEIPQAHSITARHVLSHSSGLQNWRFSKGDKLTLRFQPGAGFSYSGEGYVWLQRVTEKLTGKGYARYVRDHIFDPLEMHDSTFSYNSTLYNRMVPGYKNDGSQGDDYGARIGSAMQAIADREGSDLSDWNFRKVTEVYPSIESNLPPLPVFLYPNAAGSLVTTVLDYAKVLRAMIDDDGGALSITTSLQRSLLTATAQVGPIINWGLGWGLETTTGNTITFHTCETRYFKGMALMDTQHKNALVVLTNGANGDKVYDPLVRGSTGLKLTSLNQF